MKYLFFLLYSITFSSCLYGQIIDPSASPIDAASYGFKSKIVYPSYDSNRIAIMEDFEYNNKGKLIKKSFYGGDRIILYYYNLFNYDASGKLIYKLDYLNDNLDSSTTLVLHDSTIYLYNGNTLVNEKIIYPLEKYFDEYKYDYDKNDLIKMFFYHKGELKYYITYEYKDNKLHREYFNGEYENREYIYNGNRLVGTIEKRGDKRRSYSYDANGKLILEKVEEVSADSSKVSRIIKYIY